MARHYDEYTKRGATIAAVVVDTPGQNAAMVAKLALPFPILSDPDGAGAITPFGAQDESRPIARPAIVALAPDGAELYRYVGIDFMDRPPDDAILDALSAVSIPPRPGVSGPISHIPPEPGARTIPLRDLGIYLRGVRFATAGLAARAQDPHDKHEAERTATMAEAFLKAQGATMQMIGS